MPEGIPRREFIFSTYVKNKDDKAADLQAVKENLHFADGTIIPNLRLVPNYQRTFYVTKKDARNHVDKKEWEYMNLCEAYSCTHAELPRKTNQALELFDPKAWKPPASPYLYGTDVSPTVLMGQDYRNREPELSSATSLAMMDYETDVCNGTGMIISGALTFKDRSVIAVTEEFLGPLVDVAAERFTELRQKYIGKHVNARGTKHEFIICKDAGAVIVALFKRAHEWKPDILGFWNMIFDVRKIELAAMHYNIDLPYLYSDPSVPPENKYYKFVEDEKIKTTADGKSMIKHPADLLHVVTAPASFYCLDLMGLFKRVRGREQQRNSYSLDATLKSELDLTKLKFDAADGLTSLEWHKFLQTNYKLEYLVYMEWDCISVEMLDEKTGDVARSLRPMADISDFAKIASNPKRLADNFHFILDKEGKAAGSVGGDLTEALDSKLPNLSGWIIALAAELVTDISRNFISDFPLMETNITAHAADIDVKSAYPTTGSILNVSKGTTIVEVCPTPGVPEFERRSIGINLSSCKTNGLELAQKAYGFPELDTLLTEFEEVA